MWGAGSKDVLAMRLYECKDDGDSDNDDHKMYNRRTFEDENEATKYFALLRRIQLTELNYAQRKPEWEGKCFSIINILFSPLLCVIYG